MLSDRPVVILALQYNVKPVEGQWRRPGADTCKMPVMVRPPTEKILVRMLPRGGWDVGPSKILSRPDEKKI